MNPIKVSCICPVVSKFEFEPLSIHAILCVCSKYALCTCSINPKFAYYPYFLQRTLEKEARAAKWLVIWTDCDREGENIGYQIIEVCQSVNRNLRVFRAQFSEITPQSIQRALQTLAQVSFC